MKIQPIGDLDTEKVAIRSEKGVGKSRLKRLFERQFCNVSRKPENSTDFEPSSVCLAKMVQNFIEESNEKQKCGRNRCSCFNGNCWDSSDDECSRSFGDSMGSEACEVLKSLVCSRSSLERNLLAEASKIIDNTKISDKSKEDCRKAVAEGLVAIGYNASVCKSRWDKSSSFPSGEYEYIDVIVDKERLLIDTDFRSEFEIARSTSNYKAVLQTLPLVFVGKGERLKEIVSIVSEAAKRSLKKKGMHLPPWRKAEYMKAKWLSPCTRTITITSNQSNFCLIKTNNFSGEFELVFAEKKLELEHKSIQADEADKICVVVSPWKPPAIKPKTSPLSGLASVLEEKDQHLEDIRGKIGL